MTNNNKQIAISVADSSDLASLGISKEQFNELVIGLSRQILKAGGKIIYGGKLIKGSFTEKFREISCLYVKEDGAEKGEINIINYLAWPYYNRMTVAEEKDYLSSRMRIVKAEPSKYVDKAIKDEFIPLSDDYNRFLFATSMTSMRMQAEQNTSARVIVGGKTIGFSGCMPGILEEFIIARKKKHPIFLIGGFGGATNIITEIIEKKKGVTSESFMKALMSDPQYKSLLVYYEKKDQPVDLCLLDKTSVEDMNNGLTEEENLRLFHSADAGEIVSLVLKGLKAKQIL